jgi:hypothetical protein
MRRPRCIITFRPAGCASRRTRSRPIDSIATTIVLIAAAIFSYYRFFKGCLLARRRFDAIRHLSKRLGRDLYGIDHGPH